MNIHRASVTYSVIAVALIAACSGAGNAFLP